MLNDLGKVAAGFFGIATGALIWQTATLRTEFTAAAGPHTNQQVTYQAEVPNKGLLSVLGISLVAFSAGGMILTVGKKNSEAQDSKVLPPATLPLVQNFTHPTTQTNNQTVTYHQPMNNEPQPQFIYPTPPVPPTTNQELPFPKRPDGTENYSYSVDDIWDAGDSGNTSNILPAQTVPQKLEGSYIPPVVQINESWRSLEIALVQQLVQNDLSFALAGLPGAGKTTLLLAWLAESVKAHKGVQFYINGWKADDWLGLAKIPGVYKRNYRKGNESNFDGFFEQVNAVSDVLHERLALSKSKRKGLGKVWLILDDYFATANGLAGSKREQAERWETAKAQMGEIITVGREVGVALCVATQSLNVKALGCDDANIRGCFGLCALAKVYTTQNGRKEGGYSTITNLWNNPYLVPSEYRDKIVSEFNQARPVSEKTGYAVAFTTCGEPAIGLFTEDLAWVDDYQIPIIKSKPKQETEQSQEKQDALAYLKEFAQKQGLDLETPPENIS